MIDTHCHLTFPDFEGRVPQVLDEAAAAGVTGAITISTTTVDCHDAARIARAHGRVWCTAGVHPLYADRAPHDWAGLRRAAGGDRCVAWGELGLDNHYDRPAPAVQRAVLEEQLAVIENARRATPATDLPLVLHCREAFADLIPILRASGLDASRMVFHCFTGTPDDMRMVLDFGACVSFTGVLTYRNAPGVRESARMVPPGRCMVETDAPFLPPEPHRSVRPCRPAMVRLTAEALAACRGQSFDDLHAEINATTTRFFGIPAC